MPIGDLNSFFVFFSGLRDAVRPRKLLWNFLPRTSMAAEDEGTDRLGGRSRRRGAQRMRFTHADSTGAGQGAAARPGRARRRRCPCQSDLKSASPGERAARWARAPIDAARRAGRTRALHTRRIWPAVPLTRAAARTGGSFWDELARRLDDSIDDSSADDRAAGSRPRMGSLGRSTSEVGGAVIPRRHGARRRAGRGGDAWRPPRGARAQNRARARAAQAHGRGAQQEAVPHARVHAHCTNAFARRALSIFAQRGVDTW